MTNAIIQGSNIIDTLVQQIVQAIRPFSYVVFATAPTRYERKYR